MYTRAVLIAAKGTSHRWSGKNLALLPSVLAAIPTKWASTIVVGTDDDDIARLAVGAGAELFLRGPDDGEDPVAAIWRRMAEKVKAEEYFCPLANVVGLEPSDFYACQALLSYVDQVKSYSPGGTESGLFACRAHVLHTKTPIAACTGAITTASRELHYAHET